MYCLVKPVFTHESLHTTHFKVLCCLLARWDHHQDINPCSLIEQTSSTNIHLFIYWPWQIKLIIEFTFKSNYHCCTLHALITNMSYNTKDQGLIKSKFVPVLNKLSSMSCRHMEELRYSLTILDIDTRWRWLVSCTPLKLYPRAERPQYTLYRRRRGPQSRFGHCQEIRKWLNCSTCFGP
jgi:hypothetical protein